MLIQFIMKRVAFYQWLLPPEVVGGKPRASRWKMTEETAEKYPGAVKIESTLEWRDLPESPDEFQYTSGFQNRSRP
jgi:hypothetical protein